MSTKRRIMHQFELGELSAVDHPAQVHAKAVIMKSNHPITTEKDRAASFATFEDACEHLRKTGLGRTEAMTAARHANPELFAKSQNREHKVTDEEETIAKARAGRTQQNKIDAMVRAKSTEMGISRTDALREIRKSTPEAFED